MQMDVEYDCVVYLAKVSAVHFLCSRFFFSVQNLYIHVPSILVSDFFIPIASTLRIMRSYVYATLIKAIIINYGK